MAKVVLITGASSGIGKITAEYLLQKGFIVYGTSRNPKKENYNFRIMQLDVKDMNSIKTAIETVIKREHRIDVLINNAGMGITGPIEDTPTDEMRSVFDTNFFGAVDVIKCVLPQMRLQASGLIINITSIAGYMGLPYRGIYSATKGALEIITETLRMEVKNFGIEITNIAPGDFATNIASGRYQTPVLEDSPYKKSYKENLDLMNSHVSEGSNPMQMAKFIGRIIDKPKPRIHYKVGSFLQKFSIVLKRILPDKIFEKMMMNHYKM